MSTFISYSRTNSDFVLHLAKDLKVAGLDVWLDQLDIPTGARWDDELEKALINCSIFLIILSPEAIQSQNVKDEIGYAIDAGKQILPLTIKNCVIPLRLRRFQYVDFSNKSYEDSLLDIKRLLILKAPSDPRNESKPSYVANPVAEADTSQTTATHHLTAISAGIFQQMPQRLKDLLNSGSEYIDIPLFEFRSENIEDFLFCELKMRETPASFVFCVSNEIQIGYVAAYLAKRTLPHLAQQDYEWSLVVDGSTIPPYHSFRSTGIKSGNTVFLKGNHKYPAVAPCVIPSHLRRRKRWWWPF